MPSVPDSKTHSLITVPLLPAEARYVLASQSWRSYQSRAVPECRRHSADQR